MANMTVNQRNQFDRVELSVPTVGVAVRHRRLLIAFTLLGVVLVGALGYAAVAVMDGWSQFVVFGFIVLTAIGAMIAVSPTRRW